MSDIDDAPESTPRDPSDAPRSAPLDLLTQGTSAVVPEKGLDELLFQSERSGIPLRVKLGVDPTARRVTLGWAVVLRRLRKFQDLGHTAVLIMGDFTATVGDPSGRSKTRPRLSKAEVDANTESCLAALTSIVSTDRLEVRRNSEWLGSLDAEQFLWLTSHSTVARMLERDDFSARFKAEAPISLVEFIYPLLQAFDSVQVEADIELGGNDQLFNLLVGREIQRAAGQPPQVCLTMPLLRGTDGIQKMSQSYGNYIAVDEEASEMFGKVMSIGDDLIPEYFELATDLSPAEVGLIRNSLASGKTTPRDAKRRLAGEIVSLYHGGDAAAAAEAQFDAVFVRHELPDEIDEFSIDPSHLVEGAIWIGRLLAEAGLAKSNSEGRRLVSQGGVKIDGVPVTDPDAQFSPEELSGKAVTVGRRRAIRISG